MQEFTNSEFPDDALLIALQKWTSEERHQQAKSARISSAVHAQLAEDEARFSGLLLDLNELGNRVRINTAQGKSHSGSVASIGSDFVMMASPERSSTIIRTTAISSVQVETGPRSLGAPSGRTIGSNEISIEAVLGELAADRARIRFLLTDENEMRSGELFSTGQDFCTIGLGSPPERTLFVPFQAFVEICLA